MVRNADIVLLAKGASPGLWVRIPPGTSLATNNSPPLLRRCPVGVGRVFGAVSLIRASQIPAVLVGGCLCTAPSIYVYIPIYIYRVPSRNYTVKLLVIYILS